MPRAPIDRCTQHNRSSGGRSSQAVTAPAPPHQRQDEPSTLYLSGPDVRRRYAVSDMTLWRWLRDAWLAFPQPAMRVKDRRYWLETDLVKWERSRRPDIHSQPPVMPVEKALAKAPRRREVTP
jgi:predicted DNA-binding transcriptional regulator AlpA